MREAQHLYIELIAGGSDKGPFQLEQPELWLRGRGPSDLLCRSPFLFIYHLLANDQERSLIKECNLQATFSNNELWTIKKIHISVSNHVS